MAKVITGINGDGLAASTDINGEALELGIDGDGKVFTIGGKEIAGTGGGSVTLTSSDGSITTEHNDLTFTNRRIENEPRLFEATRVYTSRSAQTSTFQGGQQYWFEWTETQATRFPPGTRIGLQTGTWWQGSSRLLLYLDNTPTGDYIELVSGQPVPSPIQTTETFNSFVWTAGSGTWANLNDFGGFKLEWTEQVVHNDVYAETDDMNTALAAKQDRLTAGAGISISGNTISNTAPAATITTDEFAGKTDKVVAVGSANLHMHYTPTEVAESTTRHYGWTPASYVFSAWSPVHDVTNMASITVPSTALGADLILNFDGLEFPWGAPSNGDELVFTVRRNGLELRKLSTVYSSSEGAFEEIQLHNIGSSGGVPYTLDFLVADQPRLLYSLSIQGTMQITGGYDEEVTETRTVCNVPDYTLDDNDKVTAIDGHEIAGGGGGTEYTGVAPVSVDNDSHEISVDTVPVHYQQITHDDSLVHQSNDTVYALGVNVPYIKWLMGVDETVLYDNQSGAATSSISLTETPMNFEKVKVYFGTPIGTVSANSNIGVSYTEVLTRTFSYSAAAGHGYLTLNGFFYGTNSNQSNPYFTVGQFTGCDTTTWTQGASGIINKVGTTTVTTNPTWIAIHKIVGVHRKTWNGGN